jgi:hypothetical protein
MENLVDVSVNENQTNQGFESRRVVRVRVVVRKGLGERDAIESAHTVKSSANRTGRRNTNIAEKANPIKASPNVLAMGLTMIEVQGE